MQNAPKAGQAERVGRYELVRRLASGGMGEVFLAKSLGAAGFQKHVVIKKLLPHLVEHPQTVEGLVREAKLLVMLNHPNIVQVLDLGVEGGDYFMAMEYVHGYTLSSILHYCATKKMVIPAPACAHIGLEVLSALAYAHELKSPAGERQNIIHRDVSPQNVMITFSGQVKLTDFGIAKVLSEAEDELTQNLKGKWRYMAPEAVDGGRVDQRYDLFAVGILLFEALCRRNLFTGKRDVDILRKVREAKIPPISNYYPDPPEQLVQVIEHALQKDPSQRYQTAREFTGALTGAISPTTENQAATELQQFVNNLFYLDDFPLGKPKIIDPNSLESGQTHSLKLHSRLSYPQAPARRAGKLIVLLLSVAVVLISVVVAIMAHKVLSSEPPSQEKPPVIIVSERANPDIHPPSPEPLDAQAAPSKPDAMPKTKNKKSVVAKHNHKSPAKPFTSEIGARVFRRHQPEIIKCFKRYSTLKEKEVKMNVATTIRRNGVTEKVELEPRELNQSQLGRCVIRVAKKIHYPRHDKSSVVFLLPIKLRKDQTR